MLTAVQTFLFIVRLCLCLVQLKLFWTLWKTVSRDIECFKVVSTLDLSYNHVNSRQYFFFCFLSPHLPYTL